MVPAVPLPVEQAVSTAITAAARAATALRRPLHEVKVEFMHLGHPQGATRGSH